MLAAVALLGGEATQQGRVFSFVYSIIGVVYALVSSFFITLRCRGYRLLHGAHPKHLCYALRSTLIDSTYTDESNNSIL